MAFSLRQTNYKALKKLSLSERLAAVSDPNTGQFLISLLTPTQAALLFPKYYLDRRPDISGFLKALPTSVTIARQRSYEEQLENTASGSSAGANYDAGGYRRRWQQEMDSQRATVSSSKNKPMPQLSPEQISAIESLKAGDISIDDERMKFLRNVPENIRQEVGISITKSESGKEIYHYTPKQFSDEEVRKSLNVSDKARAIEKVANRLGIAPKDLAAVMHYESAGTMSTAKWGGKGGNYLGLIQFGPAERDQFGVYPGQPFDEQAEAAGRFLEARGLKNWIANNPNASVEEKRIALYSTINAGSPNRSNWYKSDNGGRDNVITHTQRIFDQHYGAAEKFMGPLSDDPITKDFSKETIEAKRQQLIAEHEVRNLQKLAAVTQPAGPSNAAGPVTNIEATSKTTGIDAYLSAGTGQCGVGTRKAAGQLFGSDYFSKGIGIGGSAQAASLSGSNDYLQQSGFYRNKQSIGIDQATDPSYQQSLPIGTVISSKGGNSNGDGHVQIKIGPNRWVSYFDQKSGVLRPTASRNYYDYAVHLPNENGIKRMQEMGHVTSPIIEAKKQETPKELPRDQIKPLTDVVQPNGPTNANLDSKRVEKKKVDKTEPVPVKKEDTGKAESNHDKATTAPTKIEPVKTDLATVSKEPASTPKEADKPASTIVKTNETGGTNKVTSGEVTAYPIGGIKGDNAVVVDTNKKPLFTMNTDETAVMDGEKKTVEVLPKSRQETLKPSVEPTEGEETNLVSSMREDFDQEIKELHQKFEQLSPVNIKSNQGMTQRPNDMPMNWIESLHNEIDQTFQNPAIRRAVNRSKGVETGEPRNNYHFSNGNRT